MDNEREFVNYTDEEGNEGVFEVLDYFFYNGDEYAVMTEGDDEEECDHDHDHDHDCDCEVEVFFMKVVPLEGDEIELLPVDDELAEKLFEVVNSQYDEEDDE